MLTLSKALRTGRLEEFIAQEESQGIDPKEFGLIAGTDSTLRHRQDLLVYVLPHAD